MNIVIGLLGPVLDFGKGAKRWEKWRPSISVCQHDDFKVDQFELLYQSQYARLARQLTGDIGTISPETSVNTHVTEIADPWDFEQVYATLHDFASSYPFDTDKHNYYVHITTGTHVAQICMFLLTESRDFPAQLLQTSPPVKRGEGSPVYSLIDLDLSRYDRIASRFQRKQNEGLSFLKSGIETRNKAFNEMMAQIEEVSIKSKAPILLSGATGVGKTRLARRIYNLKKQRHQIEGPFVEVNCATLRGDMAMSTLFGHKKGAFTGAASDRVGVLKQADNGMLFLDEIGELGLDEQAMLLHALEDKHFRPMGRDEEESSDFQLIAGTNKALQSAVANGKFRDDLLARINLWEYELPGLKDRVEDIDANIDFELQKFAERNGTRVTINREARAAYLRFAKSSGATWNGNFRDLSASITRMATLAPGGRIGRAGVNQEIKRLEKSWGSTANNSDYEALKQLMGEQAYAELDRFDLVQLLDVVQVCKREKSLAAAGRTLFAQSRRQKRSTNDSDRLKKYLTKFGLEYEDISSK